MASPSKRVLISGGHRQNGSSILSPSATSAANLGGWWNARPFAARTAAGPSGRPNANAAYEWDASCSADGSTSTGCLPRERGLDQDLRLLGSRREADLIERDMLLLCPTPKIRRRCLQPGFLLVDRARR